MMNRSQQSATTGTHISDFQAAGARPLALTTTKQISYKPNWCQIANQAIRTTPVLVRTLQVLASLPIMDGLRLLKVQWSFLLMHGQLTQGHICLKILRLLEYRLVLLTYFRSICVIT